MGIGTSAANDFGATGVFGGGGGGVGIGAGLIGSSLIGGIGSLVGGGKQASAAENAAQLQYQAAQQAIGLQSQEFSTVQNLLSPFVQFGTSAATALGGMLGLGPGQSPSTSQLGSTIPVPQFAWNPSQVAQTPGYQFTMQQILGQTQNQATAQGLGRSPSNVYNLMQTAGNFASQTYNQQLQNALGINQQQLQDVNTQLAQRGQQYNMYAGATGTGAQSAAALGGTAMQYAANAGQLGIAGATALGAGGTAAAGYQAQALQGGTNALSNAAVLYAMNQGGMFGANTG